MAKKKRSRTNLLIILAIVVALTALIALPTVFFSTSQTVLAIGGHDTIDEAFAACEAYRSMRASEGQACDPCGLACPSSARDGTYETSDGRSVSFDPALCDSSYTALGNLLEVKSFCHNTIRLCEQQIQDGEITQTWNVQNGRHQEITYSSMLVFCDTGTPVDGTTDTSIIYRLVCNPGFDLIDGSRTAQSRSGLGTCTYYEEVQETSQQKDARINSVAISDPATAGQSLRITGTAQITGISGNYIVHATLGEVQRTFSVVTATGFQDRCGNDPQAATIIRQLNQNDQLVFTLDIVAPHLEAGETGRGTYTVEILTGCNGRVLDSRGGEYTLQPRQAVTDIPESFPVGEDTYPEDIDVGAIRNTASDIASSSCEEGETFMESGCTIAECVNGIPVVLDPMVCADGNSYPNPSERVGGGNALVPSGAVVEQRGFFARIACFFKTLFGGSC